MMGKREIPLLLLVSVAACAGIPPAASGHAAHPREGTYEFSGHLSGVGDMAGVVRVGRDGSIEFTRVSLACPVAVQTTVEQEVSVSCRITDLHLVRDRDSERQLARITVAVTEVARYVGCLGSGAVAGACTYRQGSNARLSTRRYSGAADVRRIE